MTPMRAIYDACRALCGPRALPTGRHDDACLALRQVYVEWAQFRLDQSTTEES